MTPEVRALVVRHLGQALADAWRRRQRDEREAPDRGQVVGANDINERVTPEPKNEGNVQTRELQRASVGRRPLRVGRTVNL